MKTPAMGYSCLSLMAISGFIAASPGTHGSMKQAEPAPSSSCPPICREKIAEAKEKCGKRGNHGCMRGVLGEAAELCEQHCLGRSSVSRMNQEETEEESAPTMCKLWVTKFPEAMKTCKVSADSAGCFERVWEDIARECLNYPPFKKMTSVSSKGQLIEAAPLHQVCWTKCVIKTPPQIDEATWHKCYKWVSGELHGIRYRRDGVCPKQLEHLISHQAVPKCRRSGDLTDCIYKIVEKVAKECFECL